MDGAELAALLGDDDCGCGFEHAGACTTQQPVARRAGRAADMRGVTTGDYLVEEELARGGMSVVYRARHTVLGRPVVLKALREEYACEPLMVRRLMVEGTALARIQHPSVVQLFGVTRFADGRAALVLEHIEGECLATRIAGGKRLSLDEAGPLVLQLAHALAAVHRAGIVHRDIKPENVLVVRQRRRAPQLKLLDFGLATFGFEKPCGNVSGTPGYMAPEIRAGRAAGPAADIYALGVLTWRLLAGRMPRPNSSFDGIPAVVPPAVAAVVARAISERPEQRQKSAVEFASALYASSRLPPEQSVARLVSAITG